MPIYTLRGCTIDVAKGGQHARVTRPQIIQGETVIQSAAAAEFTSLPAGPTAETQAQRWAMGLPRVIEDTSESPDEIDEATDGE